MNKKTLWFLIALILALVLGIILLLASRIEISFIQTVSYQDYSFADDLVELTPVGQETNFALVRGTELVYLSDKELLRELGSGELITIRPFLIDSLDTRVGLFSDLDLSVKELLANSLPELASKIPTLATNLQLLCFSENSIPGPEHYVGNSLSLVNVSECEKLGNYGFFVIYTLEIEQF